MAMSDFLADSPLPERRCSSLRPLSVKKKHGDTDFIHPSMF